MRFAGNVIWFVFGGGVAALLWLIGAVLFAISIIGLPLARSALEMAKLSAFPFGKDVIRVQDIDPDKGSAVSSTLGTILNVIWALTFGWVLFLDFLIGGVLCCLTIIGIPFGIQAFKLSGLSFWPVGRRVVDIEFANEVRRSNAQQKLSKIRDGASA